MALLISNTPEYNKLEYELNTIDTRYGEDKSFITKDIILNGNGSPSDIGYIPTPLDFYEVYISPINVNWYYGNPILATNRIVIVKCGDLVTLCLQELTIVPFVSGNLIITQSGVIPSRFLPLGINSFSTPIIVNDDNTNKLGKISIGNDGAIYVSTSVSDTGFTAGITCGFPSTYISWNR